ncbi:diacylglycerol kinase [Paraburkholderia rhynchosiae]|nr:diacylglycerol kinase [Paraburkholderia rhynchosiae]PMS28163.1 diacylglycerol kinase [Paraburkholderia rhynchosiae]
MRTRSSHASRSSNGALRAVSAGSGHRDERETASVEPFDDVSESGVPHHAGAHGLNGQGGPSGAHVASETQHEPLSPDDPFAPLPFNPYKGNRGLTRAWHAMKNSFAGFRVAIREESAFRQELTLAAILLPCGVLVPVDPVSRVLLLGSVLLVLIVELLNSSVEAAIDRISLERHELSRRAKDLGSAAVMVALGMCVMTWALIVGPLLVHWVKAWL